MDDAVDRLAGADDARWSRSTAASIEVQGRSASHNVFFGVVEAVRLGPPGPALVYHERAYKQV